MCGIAGQLNFKAVQPRVEDLRKMAHAMAHRGPDAEGLFRSGALGMVHKRLAVLDLSSAAHQPMVHQASGDAIVFNGEIYNYRSLRKDLEIAGIEFATRSDTEVLMHGMRIFGREFLQKLDGDFSLAYWREKEKTLFLARDRFGIKPLYWFKDSDRFLFASEIRCLLSQGLSITVEPDALESYLALRFARGEKTFFKNIFNFEPASWMEVGADGSMAMGRFWQLSSHLSEPASPEETALKLERAVSSRLQSDVPVGMLLSGGIDSSSLAAFAPQGTLALSYDLPHSPDANQALKLARHFGLEFQSLSHDISSTREMKSTLASLEQPIGDSIIFPTDRLFATMAAKRKVALSGEGADEAFGGYAHHQFTRRLGLVNEHLLQFTQMSLPVLSNRFCQYILARLSPYPVVNGSELMARLKVALRSRGEPWRLHLGLSEIWSANERRDLMTVRPTVTAEQFNEANWPKENGDLFFQFLRFDLKYWLSDYGLLRSDRLSMRHSLEIRMPFLQHQLVENVVASLMQPTRFRDKKNLLRAAMRDRIPEDNLNRPKFPFFVAAEQERRQLAESLQQDVLAEKNISRYGLLNPASVRRFLDVSPRGFLVGKKITALVNLQLWCSRFL